MQFDESYLQFFASTFLFSGSKLVDIENILSEMHPELHEYVKGQIICSPTNYRRRLGFVYDGECEILRLGSDGGVPLNKVTRFGSFGITSVFSDKNEYPTMITAKKATRIFYINKDNIINAITKHPDLSLKIITFLTERIEFLNGKISTFSMGDCESKVASMLYAKYEASNDKILNFNCKSAAESLNIGRASLYRALRALSDAELIEHENKKIIIKDPKGLKGISK